MIRWNLSTAGGDRAAKIGSVRGKAEHVLQPLANGRPTCRGPRVWGRCRSGRSSCFLVRRSYYRKRVMTQPSLGCADVRLRADRDISTSHDRSILVGMWSKNGDRADRSVLARWLEAIAAG